MRTILLILLGAQCCFAQFSWQVLSTNGDLFLRLSQNGAPQFDFYIGASLEQINSAAGSLMWDYSGNTYTDSSVCEALLWCRNVQQTGIPGTNNSCWNVNQAGDSQGNYQPIVAVNYSPSQQTLDVWSVCINQWFPQLAPYLQGYCQMLVRYTMMGNGSLCIRRVFILPTAVRDGAVPLSYFFVYEQPLPLSTAFTQVGYHVDQNGVIDDSWYVAPGATGVQEWKAQGQNCGYAIMQSSQITIAWVSSPSPPINNSSASIALCGLQSGSASNYFVESSFELDLDGAQPGMVIDSTAVIIPRVGYPAEFVSTLASVVAGVPQLTIYPPNGPYSGDVGGIVSTLKSLPGQPGHYTRQLAALARLIP
jgi:hypothetical protein